ncbi:MAG TPA: glycerophosphodiester phosphodiesterase family protein [Chitinophagaceae bacterium]|nr:glycerophosphodiester phosphodiesterase family protein [Chitinophagaceae bacterium]
MKKGFYLVAMASLFNACSASRKASNHQPTFADNPVVAHRGAWKAKQLPENSIASLREAIALRCTGSEFDIHRTADDSLVINHDPHFFKLPIEQTDYATLIKNRLSNGEKLPTLREYLLAGLQNNTSTRLILEIKPSAISKERGQETAVRVVRLVQELHAESMSAYISFDYDILKKVLQLDPKAHTQYLEANQPPDQVKADGMGGIDYHYSAFTKHPEWIESAKKNGLVLNAWTVNDTTTMDWLLKNKFDLITTNEPELLMERVKMIKK